MAISTPRRLVLLALLAVMFLWLGRIGGSANGVDVAIVERLASWRQASPDLTRIAIAVTWLGSAYTTLGLVVLVAGRLWWICHRPAAMLLAGTVFGERLIADGLKLLYQRVRPAFDLHPVVVNSSSYPSGHAANSMTAFVALSLLAVPARHRRLALALAVPLAIAVGISRPFLGVHWPSDTIGGWTLAAMVLLAMTAIAPRVLATDETQHDVIRGESPPPLRD